MFSLSNSKSVRQTPRNDPSPLRKNWPHHKGNGKRKVSWEFRPPFCIFFDIAKGISSLGVILMGSPITRNFCSENRFIEQEGYLRMRNGFIGSVDLN